MPVPRYCCMRRDNSSTGFGFSLFVKINETGQFIEDVKPHSLADKSGLKNGDFVVEVNGRNILTLSHPEVVEFIRQQGDEVCLLVLDEEARVFYENLSIIVSYTMPEVKHICTWKELSHPFEQSADISKLTLQEKPVEESKNEQPKVISSPEDIICQTPEITATVMPSEHPVDAPASFPSVPSQRIGIIVSEPSQVTKMIVVAETPKAEETQVIVEELQKVPTIDEVQVETQEKAPNKKKSHQEIQHEAKPPKIEGKAPIEAQKMVEKSKASESVTQSPAVATLPDLSPKSLLQSRQSNGPRCTPSRRARMEALSTFGDRVKAFDEL